MNRKPSYLGMLHSNNIVIIIIINMNILFSVYIHYSNSNYLLIHIPKFIKILDINFSIIVKITGDQG